MFGRKARRIRSLLALNHEWAAAAKKAADRYEWKIEEQERWIGWLQEQIQRQAVVIDPARWGYRAHTRRDPATGRWTRDE